MGGRVLTAYLDRVLHSSANDPSGRSQVINLLRQFGAPRVNATGVGPCVGVDCNRVTSPSKLAGCLLNSTGNNKFVVSKLGLPTCSGLPFSFTTLKRTLSLTVLCRRTRKGERVESCYSRVLAHFGSLRRHPRCRFLHRGTTKKPTRLAHRRFLRELLNLRHDKIG